MQHGYEALRSLAALAIQMCGFLIAANAVLLGYGLSQRHAGFLLVASAFPLLVILLATSIVRHGFPMVYVALRAERHLAPGVDTLCSTYLAVHAPRLLRKLEPILDDQDPMPVVRRLVSARNVFGYRSPWMLFLAFAWIGQLVLFVVALWFFDYRLL